jgi:hypothetical protein
MLPLPSLLTSQCLRGSPSSPRCTCGWLPARQKRLYAVVGSQRSSIASSLFGRTQTIDCRPGGDARPRSISRRVGRSSLEEFIQTVGDFQRLQPTPPTPIHSDAGGAPCPLRWTIRHAHRFRDEGRLALLKRSRQSDSRRRRDVDQRARRAAPVRAVCGGKVRTSC